MPEASLGLLVRIVLVVLLLGLGLVAARRLLLDFPAQDPADYAGTGPPFDLRRTLSGRLVASGVIYGPTGRVATRFVADMRGTWNDPGGTLVEDFRYSSGATQARAWRITPGEGGRFTATADDVVGVGEGRVSGATATLRYRLRLPEQAGGREVDVTDWLYRGEDGVIVNRAQFRRFGILVGELVGTVRPVGA